jgi:hypothetical protein
MYCGNILEIKHPKKISIDKRDIYGFLVNLDLDLNSNLYN